MLCKILCMPNEFLSAFRINKIKVDTMTKTLGVSEARQNLTDLVDRVKRLQARYIITVNGRADAVILSHAEFESWQETLDVLSDREELASIERGLSQIANGDTISYEEIFGEPLNARKASKR